MYLDSETLGNKTKYLKNENEHYQNELQQEEKFNNKYQVEVQELQEKIVNYKDVAKKEEARKQEMDKKMDEIKDKIDKAKEEQKKKIDMIS